MKNKVYIINKNNINEEKFIEEYKNELQNYSRHLVRKHIYSTLKSVSINVYGKCKRLIHSKLPINSLCNIIGTSVGGFNEINPLVPPANSKYVIYKHISDQFESFISDDMFYIIR